MTDLYETPDLPGETEATEDKPGETIEEITARLIHQRDERIKALERELKAAPKEWESAVENANSMLSCSACINRKYNNEDGIHCALKSCHPVYRGPVAGENVEAEQ